MSAERTARLTSARERTASWHVAEAAPRIRALASRVSRDSLLRNSSYIMATTIVTSALGSLYWVLAARLYPPRTLGLGAALISAMTLTSLTSTFGLQATLVHRLPRRAAGREWSATVTAALAAAVLFSTAGGAIAIAALPLLSPRFGIVREDPWYAVAFAAGVVLMTAATVLDYAFVAERAAGKMLVRNAIFSGVKVVFVAVPAAVSATGAFAILGSWVAGALIGAAVALALVPHLRRDWRPSRWGVRGEVRAMIPTLPVQHAVSITAALPMFALPLLVATRLSIRENAYFYTTWMIGSLFFIISPAVSWALFAEARNQGTDLARAARRSALFTLVLLAPLALAFATGGDVVLSLFGAEYAAHGSLLLTVLVLSAFPDGVTNLFVSVMRARGTLKPAVLVNVGMAVETLVLAWFLLPPLGIAGAGWAWLIAQLSGCVFVAAHLIKARATATVTPSPDAAR